MIKFVIGDTVYSEPLSQVESDDLQSEQDLWYAERNGPDHKVRLLAKSGAKNKHPHNINYVIEMEKDLFPKRTFTFGVLTNVKWYSDEALTDLVIDVDVNYNQDQNGLAVDRTVTRTWFMTDDTPDPETKITKKLYTINPQDQLDEAIRRRTNNVRQTNMALIGLVPLLTASDPTQTDMTAAETILAGNAFFDLYNHEESVFIKTGGTSLEDAVRNDTDPQFNWLNTDATSLGITGVVDIRGYIIYQLSSGLRTS